MSAPSIAPSPFAMHVFSRPTAVSTDTWREWYIKEHLPDMVGSGASTRATFYRNLPDLSATKDPNRQFLALYQTDFKDCMESENYLKGVRRTSGLFPDKDADCWRYGDFDIRHYELVETYDVNGKGEGSAPFILHVEINPPGYAAAPEAGEAELAKWYAEEHFALISKVPGWRRSLRYKITQTTAGGNAAAKDPAAFVAVHEYDNLDGAQGPEAQEMRGTEWAKKMISGAEIFKVGAWERVTGEGY